MKKQPDDGLDAVHTALAVAIQDEDFDRIRAALGSCTVRGCEECGRLICPHHDPMHYCQGGCPSCAQEEDE